MVTRGNYKFYPNVWLICLAFLSLPGVAWAAREGALDADWDRLIDRPWQACHAADFSDHGVPPRRVAYRRCGDFKAKSPVLVVPGYTEPAMKYIELVSDLGASLPNLGPWYVVDLPGQGASERLVDEAHADHRVVHVDHPERYPNSLIQIINDVILPENQNARPLVIAHSTGALVLITAIKRSPGLVRSSILTAPLIRPKMPFPNFFVAGVAWLYCRLGLCADTAWGRQTVPIENKTFEENMATSSRSRWNAAHRIPLKYPDYYSSGTSWGWLQMAMSLGSEVGASADPMGGKTLMLMAGNDGYIDSSASRIACAKSKSCTEINFSSSRHEIFHESDQIRDEALRHVTEFLTGN